MTVPEPTVSEAKSVGAHMHALAAELYPICRSLTGEGVRQTLRILGREIPLQVREVPSGTAVFDWTVPREWNIRDAWIKDERGEKVVDFRRHNLHVVGYSAPVRARLPLAELKAHLFSLPEQPDLIPYRTSYYKETWGFCLAHRVLESLRDGQYEVCIDSTLAPGSLTWAECFLPGETPQEFLFSCHVCHPSLANDNLSGMVVAVELAKHLAGMARRRFSYRFLFIPGTIGSITWLALNEENAARVRHGLVLTCLGDPGPMTYKRSRRGDAEIDRAAAHVLKSSGEADQVIDFFPYGYDERQYCSPGFNLPVGCLMRTPHGKFPQYHTSADNLELVRPECLEDSLRKLQSIVAVVEHNRTYVNRLPKCEPQLGKRGLYGSVGGQSDRKAFEMALLWVLNLSDGTANLLAIAERAGLKFELARAAAELLEQHGLLGEAARDASSA
jgi:aminopeptidase-like protein